SPEDAGGRWRHLPVDIRLRGDPPPPGPRGSPELGVDAGPGSRPGPGGLLARHADARHAGRLPRPPRVPTAGDRTAARSLAPRLGDVRPRPPGGGVRPRRRARGDGPDRPRRAALAQALPGQAAAALRVRVRLLRPPGLGPLGAERLLGAEGPRPA